MTDDLVARLAEAIPRVRARRPLVHYMPNLVTAGDVANALLAAGASPVMAVAAEEVGEIQGEALALNMGTPTLERLEAMAIAGRAAAARGAPIVLDPVGVGATPLRRRHARQFLTELPVLALRLNASEAVALVGLGAGAPGVDAVDVATLSDTITLAQRLALLYRCVAAVTGPTDIVSDGQRTIIIDNGHPLLATISGSGCMATGLAAAWNVVADDPLLGTAAALVAFGVAAEVAAERAQGPGTLRMGLFDALNRLDPAIVRARGKAKWL